MRVVAAGLAIAASSPALAIPANFSSSAERILTTAAPATEPGISAVVAENGRIVWQGASGKADLGSGAPLTPDSLFRYASITKQFTAALVLKLTEEGPLSLDDTVGKLLPTETPAAWHAVTVRQLLNHTSGIPSYTGKPGFMTEENTGRAITTQQLIDVTRDMPVNFAPGTQFRYNNTGYVLLSAIVEKLTGKPWYAALREKITGPLGLTSIRCGCEPGPAIVSGYTRGNALAQKIDMTVPSGAGALVGNAADLAKWAAALHGGKVLKPATYQAMITPITLPDADERYAFGLGIGDVRGLSTIEHNGGIFGFSTESIYVPSKKLFVAALGNSDSGAADPGGTARRLLAEAAGVPFPVLKAQAVDTAALQSSFGVYKDDKGERRFFARGGQLYTQRTGGGELEVFSAGGGRFFYGPRSLSYFDVAKGADGKPAMSFYPDGAMKAQVASWTGPVPAEAPALKLETAVLERLTGTYVGPAPMIIALEGGQLTAKLANQPQVALQAVSASEFRPKGIDARLMFEEADGKVARVVLQQGANTMTFNRQ